MSAEPIAGADSTSSSRRKLIFRYGVSLALLTYIFSQLDLSQIDEILVNSQPVLLLAVVFIYVLERLLAAYRWHLLLGTIHALIPWRIALQITFISSFFGNFLPGIVGSELIRIYAITKSTANLSAAVSTIVFDRAIGALALMGIALSAIAFAPKNIPVSINIASVVVLILLIVGLFVVTQSKSREKIFKVFRYLSPDIIRPRIERLFLAIELIATRKKVLIVSVFLAIMFQLLRIIAVAVGAYALNYEIPIVYFLLYVPIILVVMMIPISIGGLGVREAGFVYFFGAELMPPEAAFTLSLVIYAATVIAPSPGLYFWLQGIEKHRA